MKVTAQNKTNTTTLSGCKVLSLSVLNLILHLELKLIRSIIYYKTMMVLIELSKLDVIARKFFLRNIPL